MVIRFSTPQEIELQRADEGKKIEEFWRCFLSVADDLLAGTHDPLLQMELSNHLYAIHPFLIWETGPGHSKRRQLTISPNLNPDLRETAKNIVSAAPALEDWEFQHARPRRKWNYKLTVETGRGTPIEIDASGWVFIALYFRPGAYQVLLHGENVPPLTENQRRQAAADVLVNLVGEEVVLDVISDFCLLNTLEPLAAMSTKPIRLLRETVAGPSDWRFCR
ncbi:MAG TPA: hypothetical protein VFK06_17910 [Candidatus Angelobacter sp.]|nr:hypothetical protein [Candidatus Angelobacter sp.]